MTTLIKVVFEFVEGHKHKFNDWRRFIPKNRLHFVKGFIKRGS